MKKVFLFFAMMAVAITIKAQKAELEVVDMNRTFSVGGKAIMCLRSNEANKRSLQALEWTLKNDHIGENNIVALDVKNAKTGKQVAHQSWGDNIQIRMKLDAKSKPMMYEVYDDMFSHLRIVDVDLGWVILFYSDMLKE